MIAAARGTAGPLKDILLHQITNVYNDMPKSHLFTMFLETFFSEHMMGRNLCCCIRMFRKCP